MGYNKTTTQIDRDNNQYTTMLERATGVLRRMIHSAVKQNTPLKDILSKSYFFEIEKEGCIFFSKKEFDEESHLLPLDDEQIQRIKDDNQKHGDQTITFVETNQKGRKCELLMFSTTKRNLAGYYLEVQQFYNEMSQ